MSRVIGLAPLAALAAEKPNIVFILADDLGYGDLGCYGHSTFKTPNLDRLAKQGAVFTRSYCCNSICGQTRSTSDVRAAR